MSVSSDGVKAVGAVEPVVVEHMSPVYVGGSAVSAVRSGDRVWVPLDDLHRVDGELHRMRGHADVARVDATTAQDATREAETRARLAQEAVQRLETEDAERNEAARQWADRHGFCSVFEDFCDEHGWEGRRKDYDVTVRVTVDVVVPVGNVPRGEDERSYFGERLDNEYDNSDLVAYLRDASDLSVVGTDVLNWEESE